METLRYYERLGILPRPERTDSGRRTYGRATVELLALVRKARWLGLSLEEIGAIFRQLSARAPRPAPGLLRRTLLEAVARTEQEMEALALRKERLLKLVALAGEQEASVRELVQSAFAGGRS